MAAVKLPTTEAAALQEACLEATELPTQRPRPWVVETTALSPAIHTVAVARPTQRILQAFPRASVSGHPTVGLVCHPMRTWRVPPASKEAGRLPHGDHDRCVAVAERGHLQVHQVCSCFGSAFGVAACDALAPSGGWKHGSSTPEICFETLVVCHLLACLQLHQGRRL